MTSPTTIACPPSAPAHASAPIRPLRPLRIAFGAKGGVCVYCCAYGLQRFPVTLYAAQWEQVLGNAEAIRAFILANASSLAYKS